MVRRIFPTRGLKRKRICIYGQDAFLKADRKEEDFSQARKYSLRCGWEERSREMQHPREERTVRNF